MAASTAVSEPAVGPDAELLVLGSRYAAVKAETRRLEEFDDSQERDDALWPLDDSRHMIRVQAANLIATTALGLRAKAGIIVGELGLLGIESPEEGTLSVLAASLARDVVHVLGRA